jgi:hypothetical protein
VVIKLANFNGRLLCEQPGSFAPYLLWGDQSSSGASSPREPERSTTANRAYPDLLGGHRREREIGRPQAQAQGWDVAAQ